MKLSLEKLRLLFGCSIWLVLWLALNYGLMAAVSRILLPGSF